MRPNHEYWCECTWRTNGINNTAISDRLDLRWQLSYQWHRRGIELVFKSLDCFTKWLFHSATIFLLPHMYLLFETSPGWLQDWRVLFLFLTSIWWGSTQLQCIYFLRRILISRPPRVFRRFKRCSCLHSKHQLRPYFGFDFSLAAHKQGCFISIHWILLFWFVENICYCWIKSLIINASLTKFADLLSNV